MLTPAARMRASPKMRSKASLVRASANGNMLTRSSCVGRLQVSQHRVNCAHEGAAREGKYLVEVGRGRVVALLPFHRHEQHVVDLLCVHDLVDACFHFRCSRGEPGVVPHVLLGVLHHRVAVFVDVLEPRDLQPVSGSRLARA